MANPQISLPPPQDLIKPGQILRMRHLPMNQKTAFFFALEDLWGDLRQSTDSPVYQQANNKLAEISDAAMISMTDYKVQQLTTEATATIDKQTAIWKTCGYCIYSYAVGRVESHPAYRLGVPTGKRPVLSECCVELDCEASFCWYCSKVFWTDVEPECRECRNVLKGLMVVRKRIKKQMENFNGELADVMERICGVSGDVEDYDRAEYHL